MAFLFEQTAAGGRTVVAHRVRDVRLDVRTGAAEATLSSWSSVADMQAGRPAAVSRNYTFSPSGDVLHVAAEAQIMALGEFDGAVPA